MKTGVLSVYLLISKNLLSSAQEVEFDKDYTSLLTSKVWKEGDEKVMASIFKFNADGTFFRTSSSPWLAAIDPSFDKPMDEMGKWEWISHDTFTIQTLQRIVDGEIKNLNPEPYHKAVYRIQQIDLQTIKGIRYNILEKEDSEYVTQFKWVVKE
jgi:predicted RND superfamily exporter protein